MESLPGQARALSGGRVYLFNSAHHILAYQSAKPIGADDREMMVLPPNRWSTAMNALIYPLHFHRRFEPRWATRVISDQKRRSPPQGTDACTTCGHVVTAPSRSTHLPSGKIINHWQCSTCGNTWDTFVDSRLGKRNSKALL